ncbi:transcriptional regulator SdiA [Mixta tenebrionis]|uniref:Transcriptional regulator SdiA n=1 Tax=Mixta tenebrionis TaxID=2562439 RepID=A0A506VFW1_9GAMM|nr:MULTISPECIES: transcriptional regulator SdiA [Mixta]QHM75976.1 Regulatory protein SdiA [Mixta theicola]TPW44505.1 transcriptional regulator SdiA [Mixta tenebrionis]
MTFDDYFAWRREVEAQFFLLNNPEELTQALQQRIEALGLDHFALFIRHPVPFTRPRTFLFTTYPRRWLTRYDNENYYAVDPVLRNVPPPGKFIAWGEGAAKGDEIFWREAKEYGLSSGFSCSLMASNRATGILSVASKKAVNMLKLLPEQQLGLQYLLDLALQTLLRLDDISMRLLDITLSSRELEILKWTAEGKTAAEISLILSISPYTVNFHQKNLQKRFNAPNKTQVASYAAAMGLL